MTSEQTALASMDMFSIMDELDSQAIVERINGRVSAAWVYTFEQGGKTIEGLSADGVEEAARFLARESKGTEVIREIDCRIEWEDDVEARFIATAGRYMIGVEKGKVTEVLLDTAVRGKRVEKINGRGVVNPHWYEHGVTKATRNAKRALLPEDLIAKVIEQAKVRGRTKQAPKQAVQGAADGGAVAAPASAAGGNAPDGITQPQIKAIRVMLDKAYPDDEQEQVEWMQRTEAAAVEGTAVHLGGLTKVQGSAIITELKPLVD